MIENVEKYVESVKKRGLNKKGSVCAQIIKGERLKKHKTLEEVANGICSVSYLCKMENDVLTPPSDFMKTLFEKMELDYDVISHDDFENSLHKALEFFYKESDELDELYYELKIYDSSVTIKLIKCLYNLKNKEYDQFIKDIQYLNTIKDTLGGLEALTFIYVVLKYYIDSSQYKQAFNYLQILDYIDIETKWLKFLLIEANLETSLHLCYINRFCNYYNLLNSFSYTGYDLEKKITADIMYKIIKSDEYIEEIIEDIKECKYNLSNAKSIYYSMLLKVKLNFNIDFKIIDENLFLDVKFVSLFAYNVLMNYLSEKISTSEDIKKLKQLYANINYDDQSKMDKMFVNFVLLVLEEQDENKILEFLRKEYVLTFNKYYHILFNDVYKKAYLYLLGEKSQYKEAYCFLLNTLNLNFKH